MANGIERVLEQLHQAGGGLTDGQLLARFVATRDEPSFAALVRRHGPMVLGVCRRVLGYHDAEDAFQATFLVLATRAASVVKRESVGSWLHGVAFHTAMRAVSGLGRRRSREKPMSDLPHPQVQPDEPRDWLPLLDRELNLLPEKYRAAIVTCDLEGRPRRDAARLLKVPEGTLSSRLATGRQMLAKRLARCGVTLSGGALAVALQHEAAAVPAKLVVSTAKAAALLAAGQVAAVSGTAVLLMKGVTRMMLLKKLRLVAGAVVVLVALGAVGVGYRAGGSGSAQAAPPDKPKNELDALRRENELLKINLEVVLEKVRTQEAELRELRPRGSGLPGRVSPDVPGAEPKGPATGLVAPEGPAGAMGPVPGAAAKGVPVEGQSLPGPKGPVTGNHAPGAVPPMGGSGAAPSRTQPDAVQEAEAAFKALREAKDDESRRRATESLEKSLEKLKQQGGDRRAAGAARS